MNCKQQWKVQKYNIELGLICADPENFIGGRGCFQGEGGGGLRPTLNLRNLNFPGEEGGSRSVHGHTKFQYLDPNELLPTPTMNN